MNYDKPTFSLADLYQHVALNQWNGNIITLQGDKLNSASCQQALTLLSSGEIQWQLGDRIIIRAHNDIQTIATMLAAWKIGLVVVPVKEDMNDQAIETIAQDCNAKGLCQQGQFIERINYNPEKPIFEITQTECVTGSDLALIIYTSGSTGLPKGIMLSHQNVLTSLASIAQYLKLTPQDRIICLSPLSFDYGLYQVLFALYCNCTTLLYEKTFNPIQIVKTLDSEKISVLPFVPAIASALVRVLPLLKTQLPNLRAVTNTGGHLSESVIRQWKLACTDLDVYSMYGLTECKRALYLEPHLWEEKMGSVGLPIPGLDARVFLPTEQGYKEAQPHEVGELYVRGAAVMQGYFNPNAQGGAKTISGGYRDDNWLATGDLFSRDEEGFYYFKGRSKELIKQAGFCLYPKDIENIIESCPLVHLNAIVGSQDRSGLEIALAVIELNDNTKANQEACEAWLKANIDQDYRPREYRFVEAISLTPNRKVDKKRLASELG